MKDARAALEALREEERERKRREAEEAERIRQIQMRENSQKITDLERQVTERDSEIRVLPQRSYTY